MNDLSATPERGVLPGGVDHAVDMAVMAERHHRVEVLVLDHVDAFMSVPLHADERRFNCAKVPAYFQDGQAVFVIWNVLGFGGKANPLVYARIASLAARARQALLDVQCGKLQLHVGDSAVVVVGDEQAAPLGTQTVVA